MKGQPKYIFLVFVILSVFLLQCARKEKKQKTEEFLTVRTSPPISIVFAGSVGFRRSYADIQFMEDEKEIEKYLDKQRKSNPASADYSSNKFLLTQFEKFGIVTGNQLLLHKLKLSSKENFSFRDSSGKNINVHFTYSLENGDHGINIYSGKDSSKVKVDAHYIDLKYCLLDIIPGGNKEIVVLNEYYIMNGDNFELLVYEIISSVQK